MRYTQIILLNAFSITISIIDMVTNSYISESLYFIVYFAKGVPIFVPEFLLGLVNSEGVT